MRIYIYGRVLLTTIVVMLLSCAAQAQLYISNATFTTRSASLVFVNGNVVYAGDSLRMIDHKGELELKGDWSNEGLNDRKVFTDTSTGLVIMSAGLQTFNGSNTRFPNLRLTGTDKKVQNTNIEIAQILDLTDRELDVNGHTVNVLYDASSAIWYSLGGYVNTSGDNKGWLVRSMQKDTQYVYPLGNIKDATFRFRPLILQSPVAGSFYGQFQNYTAGRDGYPVSAMASDLTNVNPLFYHRLRTDSITPVTLSVQYPNSTTSDGSYSTMSVWNTNKWEKLVSAGPVPDISYITNNNLFYAYNNVSVSTGSIPINLANDTKVGPPLKIPNVITPNGNGKNDFFQILGLERYPGSELVIVNRWGHEVYRSANYDNKWDATGLNAGVYYYILKLRQADGKIIPYKGYIDVLKK